MQMKGVIRGPFLIGVFDLTSRCVNWPQNDIKHRDTYSKAQLSNHSRDILMSYAAPYDIKHTKVYVSVQRLFTNTPSFARSGNVYQSDFQKHKILAGFYMLATGELTIKILIRVKKVNKQSLNTNFSLTLPQAMQPLFDKQESLSYYIIILELCIVS